MSEETNDSGSARTIIHHDNYVEVVWVLEDGSYKKPYIKSGFFDANKSDLLDFVAFQMADHWIQRISAPLTLNKAGRALWPELSPAEQEEKWFGLTYAQTTDLETRYMAEIAENLTKVRDDIETFLKKDIRSVDAACQGVAMGYMSGGSTGSSESSRSVRQTLINSILTHFPALEVECRFPLIHEDHETSDTTEGVLPTIYRKGCRGDITHLINEDIVFDLTLPISCYPHFENITNISLRTTTDGTEVSFWLGENIEAPEFLKRFDQWKSSFLPNDRDVNVLQVVGVPERSLDMGS